jgi:hypothetical protein
MWLPFLFTHVHFTISIFVALILSAVAWLYFDAWIASKTFREACRTFGFLLLAVSFAIDATKTETSIFGASLLPGNWLFWSVIITRIAGYLLIVLSHILDPLQPKPQSTALLFLKPASVFTAPALSLLVALSYLRRATFGLERHLKSVAIAFFLLSLSEICVAISSWQSTSNVYFYKLISPFGPVWIASHVFLFAFALILLRWVSSYLLKRFSSQLIIAFTSLTLAVFMVTTVGFTGILINNLQSQNLTQLATDAKILNFALKSQQNTVLSDTQVIAQHPDVIKLLTDENRQLLASTLQSFLLNKKQASVTVVSPTGVIIARGDDPEKHGGSLSDDSLFKRALSQGSVSTVSVASGPLYPAISIQAAAPIVSPDNKILGVVLTSATLDNAFLDNLKSATGLEASLYGGAQLSATTFTTPDGLNRPVGVYETEPSVKNQVLTKNLPYTGSVNLFGHYYLSTYLPLTDINDQPVGMIFVGRDQITILHTAGQAIQTTFIVTLFLLVLSLLPSLLIARSISRQIK